MSVPATCPTCGGAGQERALVCCNNWQPGAHNEPVCCGSPVWEITAFCSDCNGGGVIEIDAPLPSDAENGK